MKPNEPKFSDKSKINENRSFGYIRHIKKISSYVQKNTPETNRPVIEKMCNITHVCRDKLNRRASLCFALIFRHCVTLYRDATTKKLKVAATGETKKEEGKAPKQGDVTISGTTGTVNMIIHDGDDSGEPQVVAVPTERRWKINTETLKAFVICLLTWFIIFQNKYVRMPLNFDFSNFA